MGENVLEKRYKVPTASTALPVVTVQEVVNVGADSALVQAAVRALCGTYLALSAVLGLSQDLPT
jgi:hypothetical protein